MNKNGKLIISLDFELLWGVFDVVDYKEKVKYFRNTIEVVPKILDLFQIYDIHATWAVVGMLFNKNWDEWEKNRPQKLPQYQNKKLSPYEFIGRLAEHEKDAISDLVFAPELIEAIKGSKDQEVGTHTYSHFYCLEKGQNATDFEKDIERAIELAEAKGINLKTLIFPRNQIKKDYLQVCSELGIGNVRSNPDDWYWKDTLSENLFTKVARSGDAYLPFGKKTYTFKAILKDKVMQQPASRLLRPVESNKFMRHLKLNRVKNEITAAAQKGEAYHLWWHPHNFGDNPEESLNDLNVILKHFTICREQYGMESVNMQEMNVLLSGSNRS